MDARRIKDLLHAWRPGQDMPDEVTQAREIAAGDPELSAWMDNERAFDQAFANKLRDVKPPVDLLDRILSAHETGEGNVVPFSREEPPHLETRKGQFFRYAFSIAASLLIVGGIFSFAASQRGPHYDDLDSFVTATVLQAMAGSSSMHEARGFDSVAQGLQSGYAPVPGDMPERLASFKPARYGVIETRTGNIGQIGFSGNESYRLIVAERRCLGGCSQKLTKPVMFDLNDKLAVTWAKGNQVYILVSDRTGESVIRDIAKEAGASF